MARDYGKVRAQFWESESLRELSVQAKFLALYLLTSPHTNAIGCFRLPVAYIGHDTSLTKEALEKAFAELRLAKFALPCERAPWIYIPNYLRHNPPENPNVWRKCVKELDALPGEITAASIIAAELYDMAGEDRMTKEGSKSRVTDEERTKLKRFEDCFETVSNRLTPLPCPIPSPSHDLAKEDLPPKGGVSKPKGYPEDFEVFWKAYPTDPNMSKKEAGKQWAKLPPDKRVQATASLPAFKIYCEKNSDWYRPIYAERYLSEEKFEGHAAGQVIRPTAFNSAEEQENQRRLKEKFGG
jgi:hypothetical protein